MGIVPYNRVSGRAQAGRRKVKLEQKTEPLVAAIRKRFPFRVRTVVQGVETGKLADPRPYLLEAAEYAKKHGCIIVASDLSRFIRAQSYHRRKNPEAVPPMEEMDRLGIMTYRVPLLTLLDPDLTEAARHGEAIRRTKKAGRPRAITPELAEQIFADLGAYFVSRSDRWRWRTPLRLIAESYEVSPYAIQRLADTEAPGRGKTWRQLAIEKGERHQLELEEAARYWARYHRVIVPS
jgi:hypothetical protein